jgi:dTDP-4-amino-4,6-dideoxygalactose transaminase
MTEMQAAIGRAQLRKLGGWVAARRRNAAAFIAALEGAPGIRVPLPAADCFHSYYKLYAQLDLPRLRPGWSALRVIEAIEREGVPCLQGGCSEIYRELAFVDRKWGPARPLPVASRLSETSLMFLVHPTLAEADMREAAQAVAKVLRAAVRG